MNCILGHKILPLHVHHLFVYPFTIIGSPKSLTWKQPINAGISVIARTRILMTKGDHELFQLCSVVVKKQNKTMTGLSIKQPIPITLSKIQYMQTHKGISTTISFQHLGKKTIPSWFNWHLETRIYALHFVLFGSHIIEFLWRK